MAENDYKELVEFLGKQFEGIYDRLDNTASKDDLAKMATKDDLAKMATKDDLAKMASKDDLAKMATKDDLAKMATKDDLAKMATKDEMRAEIAAAKEEVMRHTGVLIEDVQHKLDLLVEGRMATHEKIERDKEENEREHGRLEKRTLINTADISVLDQRVGRLEGKA
jgi:hypothetical protein